MPDTHIVAEHAAQHVEEPLAALANRYLDRKRELDRCTTPHTDEEISAFNDVQEGLLEQMKDTPAVVLDDIIAKLEVIRCEIWDNVGGDEEQLEPADHLVLTLADDLRRVLGATTAYRFEARLWVESAIRAGMDPYAQIYLIERDDGRGYDIKQRCLGEMVAGVDPKYQPPLLRDGEAAAVIDELVRRGRASHFYSPISANRGRAGGATEMAVAE
jgi:hypothetical protein